MGIVGSSIKYLTGMELKGILVNDDGDMLKNMIIIIIITANAYSVLLYTRAVLGTSPTWSHLILI